ncbi:acetolactate synthase AlsS [Streptomyces fractus]|uniref:acetolactate synthase AlsS n=1 Tax=Streptomyces fractus TaxID=641806 RepID=UPI003CF7094D
MSSRTAAHRVVKELEAQGVTHVFGIPGAKIDAVFDGLVDGDPDLVVCRHEQNAAFMAAAVGRLTGTPGVCLVTSGPGASNLVTGLMTATTEGDPVVALVGAVGRTERLKRTHQQVDVESLFRAVTKSVAEVGTADAIPEALANAFRTAATARAGATAVAIPQDVLTETVKAPAARAAGAPRLGASPRGELEHAARLLSTARTPVILAGMRAGAPDVCAAVRDMLRATELPVVETFQAAGLVSRDLEDHFLGRVGLFRNQPGDVLLDEADVVLAVGYDPVEYGPAHWNGSGERHIIHVDCVPADIDNHYHPEIELRGHIQDNLAALTALVEGLRLNSDTQDMVDAQRGRLAEADATAHAELPDRVHPLRLLSELRAAIDDHTVVACDIGSLYIWTARNFRVYEPRKLLFSNGQQTLGVALPWAIAACLVRPGKKVVSMSGDGGFLFSAAELETAVRLSCNLVHLVWADGAYDMVAFQEQAKYGRTSGTEFGPVDHVRFAESFGATGLRVSSPDELAPVLAKALATPGPVVVDIPVDYRDNAALATALHSEVLQ